MEAKLFFGGPIVTMDERQPEAEALVTRGSRIEHVGALADMRRLAGPDAVSVNLDGATLLPGLIEAHGHPMLSAQTVGDPVVDIRAVQTPTYEAIVAKMKRRLAKAKAGDVIWFTGLDLQLHADVHEPTRDELDALSSDVGVVVQTTNLHAIYMNAAALAALGVPANAADKPNSHITRDSKGRLWKFSETARRPLMAAFALRCGEQRNLTALADWLHKYSRAGYTTVCEPGLSALMAGFYEALISQRDLPVRLFAYQYAQEDGVSQLPVDQGSDLFGVIGTKMWADGSVLVGNIGVTRSYLNTEMTLRRMGLPEDSTGGLNWRSETLHAMIESYASQGHQIAVHAQGDRTIDVVLDIYEDVLSARANAKRPFRLEHCGLMRDDQLDRAKALGVACSFFVPMHYYWGQSMVGMLGEERASRFAPIGSAARRGLDASYHCDAPMTYPAPALILYAATTRRTHGGGVLGADQAVDIDTALRAVTINAARHIRADDRLGSITSGKYADFTLIDRDPRKTPPEELRNLHILGAFLGSKPVWQTRQFASA